MTQAVSITDDTKQDISSAQNLEASFINLIGYKNKGKNLVI